MGDFANMPQLEELNLSHNQIKKIPPKLFSNLVKLKSLDLSNNNLNEDIDPSVFQVLPSTLSSLDISSECNTIPWIYLLVLIKQDGFFLR